MYDIRNMRLADSVEWAIHCIWVVALAPSGKAVPTRRLAELYGLPESYLAKVLKSLVRSDLLRAASGPKGGYTLAKPAHEISVVDTVDAIEGRGPLFHCAEIRRAGPVPPSAADCRKPCGIAQVMTRAEGAWRTELSATTVADLVARSSVGSLGRVTTWLGSSIPVSKGIAKVS
jgi:Rrf2 family protein